MQGLTLCALPALPLVLVIQNREGKSRIKTQSSSFLVFTKPIPNSLVNMNPNLPFPLVNGAFIIDTTTLEYYTTCRRAYEYYALEKRRSASNKWALSFGLAFHHAMQAKYDQDADVDAQLSVVREFFNENPPPPDDHRDTTYMTELLMGYDLFYTDEPFTVVASDTGQRMVEVPFCLPLKNADGTPFTVFLEKFTPGLGGAVEGSQLLLQEVPVFYSGRIDMLTLWDGLLYPLDHKTTSIMGDKYFDEFQNSQQPIGYSWAVREITGKAPGGYVINAVATRRLTKSGAGIEYRRQKYFLEPERIDEWLENTRYIIQDIVADYHRGYFPMETKWCVAKYGKCPYFDVCVLPAPARPMLLASNLYETNDWSPLNQPKGSA